VRVMCESSRDVYLCSNLCCFLWSDNKKWAGKKIPSKKCECSCDVQLCSLLCCS
jgi:hypothetical protein